MGRRSLLCRAGLALFILFTLNPAASAIPSAPDVFGDDFKKLLPVTNELSQVIYYRQMRNPHVAGGANIYIDGKMHTSLMPGGFTSFCVLPGDHTLGVFLSSMPRGSHEQRPEFITRMKGGHTYYLRVNEYALLDTPPQVVRRVSGEQELKHTRRQTHLLSRAQSTLPCVYDYDRAQPMIEYLLSAPELFYINAELSQQGREAIADLAVQIRQNFVRPSQIRLVTGATGADETRLNSIRRALIEADIPARLITVDRSTDVQSAAQISVQVN